MPSRISWIWQLRLHYGMLCPGDAYKVVNLRIWLIKSVLTYMVFLLTRPALAVEVRLIWYAAMRDLVVPRILIFNFKIRLIEYFLENLVEGWASEKLFWKKNNISDEWYVFFSVKYFFIPFEFIAKPEKWGQIHLHIYVKLSLRPPYSRGSSKSSNNIGSRIRKLPGG